MRLFLYILLILMPVSAMAKQTLATTDITDERHLLELLDGYIEKRDVYAKQKEEKLKQLKLRLRTADDNAARLAILNSIYREYYTYRYDSALVYGIDRQLQKVMLLIVQVVLKFRLVAERFPIIV